MAVVSSPQVELPAELTAPTGDSMAARLARQRQQRSMLRTSAIPADAADAIKSYAPPDAGQVNELKILRAEVAASGGTIARLRTQLRQSEAEMEAMGEHTLRLREQLEAMRQQAALLEGS
jgi:hypothetical protein